MLYEVREQRMEVVPTEPAATEQHHRLALTEELVVELGAVGVCVRQRPTSCLHLSSSFRGQESSCSASPDSRRQSAGACRI